jgi:hypothetical protein
LSDTNLLSDDNTNHSSFAPVIASTPVADLEQHHKDGFVGVRFNPGLWPKLEAGAERPTAAAAEAERVAAEPDAAAAAAEREAAAARESEHMAMFGDGGDDGFDPSERIGGLDEFGMLKRTVPPAVAAVAAVAGVGGMGGAAEGGPVYAAGRLQGGSSTLTMGMQAASYSNHLAAQAGGGMLTKTKGNTFHERHDYSQPKPTVHPTKPNPNESMFDAVGRALFAKAGELNMPVGFMCFQGFDMHADDIEALVKTYPETVSQSVRPSVRPSVSQSVSQLVS